MVRPIGGGVREQGPGWGSGQGPRIPEWEVGGGKFGFRGRVPGRWVGTRRWSPGLSGRRGGRLGAALNWAEAGTEDRLPAACILASMSCHSGPGFRKGPFPGRTGLIDPGSNRDTFAYISARPGEGDFRCHVASFSRPRNSTVLKPVPGSGSRAKCAQFRGSSDAKHVSSWFQPWATLWPTCHMLVPASLLQSVECSTECKNSIFHCTIGCVCVCLRRT